MIYFVEFADHPVAIHHYMFLDTITTNFEKNFLLYYSLTDKL